MLSSSLSSAYGLASSMAFSETELNERKKTDLLAELNSVTSSVIMQPNIGEMIGIKSGITAAVDFAFSQSVNEYQANGLDTPLLQLNQLISLLSDTSITPECKKTALLLLPSNKDDIVYKLYSIGLTLAYLQRGATTDEQYKESQQAGADYIFQLVTSKANIFGLADNQLGTLYNAVAKDLGLPLQTVALEAVDKAWIAGIREDVHIELHDEEQRLSRSTILQPEINESELNDSESSKVPEAQDVENALGIKESPEIEDVTDTVKKTAEETSSQYFLEKLTSFVELEVESDPESSRYPESKENDQQMTEVFHVKQDQTALHLHQRPFIIGHTQFPPPKKVVFKPVPTAAPLPQAQEYKHIAATKEDMQPKKHGSASSLVGTEVCHKGERQALFTAARSEIKIQPQPIEKVSNFAELDAEPEPSPTSEFTLPRAAMEAKCEMPLAVSEQAKIEIVPLKELSFRCLAANSVLVQPQLTSLIDELVDQVNDPEILKHILNQCSDALVKSNEMNRLLFSTFVAKFRQLELLLGSRKPSPEFKNALVSTEPFENSNDLVMLLNLALECGEHLKQYRHDLAVERVLLCCINGLSHLNEANIMAGVPKLTLKQVEPLLVYVNPKHKHLLINRLDELKFQHVASKEENEHCQKLSTACQNGELPQIQALLVSQAMPSCVRSGDAVWPVLIKACEANNIDVVKALCDYAGSELKGDVVKILLPAMMVCAKAGNAELLLHIMSLAPIDLLSRDASGLNIYQYACMSQTAETIELLLQQQGIDVEDMICASGQYLIDYACEVGNLAVVKAIVTFSHIPSSVAHRRLMLATERNQTEEQADILSYLTEAVFANNRSRLASISSLADSINDEQLQQLRVKTLTIAPSTPSRLLSVLPQRIYTDKSYRQKLMKTILPLLVELPICIKFRTTTGSNLLHFIPNSVMPKLSPQNVPLIADLICDVDNNGNTPLHAMCEQGNVHGLIWLLAIKENHIDILKRALNKQNKQGARAIELALAGGHQKLVIAICEVDFHQQKYLVSKETDSTKVLREKSNCVKGLPKQVAVQGTTFRYDPDAEDDDFCIFD
ncbi:MAG: hypothetical protein ACPGUD_11415 [Parashewanella sp.]